MSGVQGAPTAKRAQTQKRKMGKEIRLKLLIPAQMTEWRLIQVGLSVFVILFADNCNCHSLNNTFHPDK